MKKVKGIGMNIQEIAKLAKVSVSTVSKIMNGKDDDISEPTRKRVLKIVEEQNYIPYAKYRMREGMGNWLVGLVISGRTDITGHWLPWWKRRSRSGDTDWWLIPYGGWTRRGWRKRWSSFGSEG